MLYYDSIEREKLSLAITERQKYYYTANQRQALSFTVAFPKVLFASGSTVGTSISIATPTYNVNVSANAVGDSLATALPSYSIDVTAITIGTSTATAAASITETRSGTTTGSSVSTCDAKAIFIEERTASTVGTSTSTATAIGETAYSPEAQAVIDRMVNTTEKQNDAIANFVDTLVASGDWDDLYDVHCFSLGNVDYLTGWKVNAGLTPVGSPVHTENDGVQFSTTSHMDLGYSAEALHLALGIDSVCVGGYVKTSANSGVNFDLCGVVSGTGVNDFYVRNRLNNDIQSLLGSTGTTPRLSPVTYPMTGFWHSSQETVNRFIQHNTSSTSSGATDTNATTWKGDNIFYNGRNNSGIQNGNAQKADFFYLGTAAVNADNMKAAIEQFRLDIL